MDCVPGRYPVFAEQSQQAPYSSQSHCLGTNKILISKISYYLKTHALYLMDGYSPSVEHKETIFSAIFCKSPLFVDVCCGLQ